MSEEKRKIKWLYPLLIGVAALIAILATIVLLPRKSYVEVQKDSIVTGNFDFIYEHWKEEKLFALRDAEDYKDLDAANQFDMYVMLCHWTHSQWKHSVPDPYPLSNGIDILSDIRSGKTGGFCGQYSYVLADVLKSMGFFSVRYVELWSNQNTSHFVVEAWLDSHKKWIVLDADQDIYYEDAETNIPLNAYEIREGLFGDALRKVVARSTVAPHENLGPKKIELYANFAVSLRSDLMRHSKPLSVQDRFLMFLFYKDQYTNERFLGTGMKIPYIHITTRLEDLYFDRNWARVEYEVVDNGNSVILSFYNDGSMPNFKGFAVSVDNGKSWDRIQGNLFKANKKDGISTVLVAPVNMYDRFGCVNELKLSL